ncbi:hypothetical protein HA44_08940 [Mixta gaviniae]|nr:hypothetical protein HA44_08940 [Mixta gaviniae]
MRNVQPDDLVSGLTRLLTCCSFTLGGTAFEGMWGVALEQREATLPQQGSLFSAQAGTTLPPQQGSLLNAQAEAAAPGKYAERAGRGDSPTRIKKATLSVALSSKGYIRTGKPGPEPLRRRC